ncbi:MAG: Lrp/AsnC family transcriptional regulator [Pseudomonadota bacterium]
MVSEIDKTDRRILQVLQRDAAISMDALAEAVHLSRNACWRRVKQMEASGVITARVALVSPRAVGLPLTAFVLIRAGTHDKSWLDTFAKAVRRMPEIQSAHRLSGELDYILRIRLASMEDYDRVYQNLIARVPLSDISASFVMDDIKDTTALPL